MKRVDLSNHYNMKIVLAEDDPFFQKFYLEKLKEKGFQVELARDGVEAIDKISTTKPDVVLLDLIMPNKDGFDVLEEVSRDNNLKKIPIIVFSTLGQEKDIEKAKQLGAIEYVNKTFFDFDNLVSKILSNVNK